jgi:hypothetical protein
MKSATYSSATTAFFVLYAFFTSAGPNHFYTRRGMRTTVLAVVAIISLPLVSHAQSTLNFPRVIPPAEFATTGFAVANPGPAAAAVTFTLYAADGSFQQSPLTIPARGQRARLASELFPSAQKPGWVQATATVSGLQGFWFGGNFVTYADGAEAAASSSALVLPLVAPQSELDIVNTGAAALTVVVDVLGPDGSDLDVPYPQLIPPNGFFNSDVGLLFPRLSSLSTATHMRIKCGCDNGTVFAAVLIARDFIAAPSRSMVNGIPASTSTVTLNFPHVVDGPQNGANWQSLLGVTNLSSTLENRVNLAFMSDTGDVLQTVQTLPPNGGIRDLARNLFQFTTPFVNGWVQVSSISGVPITGYIAYADTIAAGVTAVAPRQDGQKNLLFAHIADLRPWWTGLAILNANPVDASVAVFAVTPDGALIGKAAFTLTAGSKTSKLLSELIPQTQTRTTDGGLVFVQSNMPLFGIELFFSRDLQILANVPAASGDTYVPPQ